jgi:hypothetical protein
MVNIVTAYVERVAGAWMMRYEDEQRVLNFDKFISARKAYGTLNEGRQLETTPRGGTVERGDKQCSSSMTVNEHIQAVC